MSYISSTTGKWMTAHDATDPVYWTRHLREAVQFSSGINQLRQDENVVLLEVGPGAVLATLAKQHPAKSDNQVVVSSLGDGSGQTSECVAIQQALGQLWLGGVEPDWKKFHADAKRSRVSLPTYPFERKRFWLGSPSSQSSETKQTEADIKAAAKTMAPAPPAPGGESGTSGKEGEVSVAALELLFHHQLQALNQACAQQLAFLQGQTAALNENATQDKSPHQTDENLKSTPVSLPR